MTASRRLAAILAADVAGYSRLMGADEEGTLERLKALRRELLDPKIAEHRGRIVKTTGDGLLVEFAKCGGRQADMVVTGTSDDRLEAAPWTQLWTQTPRYGPKRDGTRSPFAPF
jgi:class 3 adenylate cyclase